MLTGQTDSQYAKGHLRGFLLIKRKVFEGQGYYVEAPQKDALTKIRTALGDNARSKIHNRNNAREFGAKFYRDEDKDEEEIY